MAVTYTSSKNSYCANVKGQQFYFSVNKYGPLAHTLAELSFERQCRVQNVIEFFDDYAILHIYSKHTNDVMQVFVDQEDVAAVENLKWFIVKGNSRTYYAANDAVGKMHRYILNENDPSNIIDHINRNGLDNRKKNLRIVSNSINKKNAYPRKDNKTGVNGVSKDSRFYYATWMDNGKQKKKRFSVNNPEAFNLAVEYRKQKEKEFNYMSTEEGSTTSL